MSDELKKLILLFWLLSVIGTVLAILQINSNYLLVVNIILSILFLFLNILSYLSFVGLGLAFITFILLLSFTIIMITISSPISKIGVYYNPKNLVSKWKQPITTNLLEIFKNNVIFSFPLYFAIMYLINPTNYLNPIPDSVLTTDVNNAFVVTLAIIPGYLLSIRLLAHPTKMSSSIPILGLILKSIRNQYFTASSFEILKERFMSFYFSLSASAFFIMMMLYLYKLVPLNLNPLDVSVYVFHSFNKAFIPIFDSDMTINMIRIVLFLVGFVIALFLTTALGEIILDKYKLLNDETDNRID